MDCRWPHSSHHIAMAISEPLEVLSHCGLVALYNDIDQDQHWLRRWLVALLYWSNIDYSSVKPCGNFIGYILDACILSDIEN